MKEILTMYECSICGEETNYCGINRLELAHIICKYCIKAILEELREMIAQRAKRKAERVG